MKYNPNTHHRHTIRLQGYDYSQEGLYFITLVCKNKISQFGKIENGNMVLNQQGMIAQEEWHKTMNIRSKYVRLHSTIVMPNHIHAIIEIIFNDKPLTILDNFEIQEDSLDNPFLKSTSKTIGSIIRGYKSAVSSKIGFSVWQRNYYDHIIRNEKSYNLIAEYIKTNPSRWKYDSLNDNYIHGENMLNIGRLM